MLTIVRELMSLGSRYPSLRYLLHYHYDRWLFKTITGAFKSAKQAQCSPGTALEAKTFSHQYWTNQHHYLIDAVRQFGFPSMFITISPFEWTFPFPPWLEHLRNQTGKAPTEHTRNHPHRRCPRAVHPRLSVRQQYEPMEGPPLC